MSVGVGCISPMAVASTDVAAVTGSDVVPRRRGKSKARNFKYDGPVSVMRLSSMPPMIVCGNAWSGNGWRRFGYGGHYNATPSIVVERIGLPTMSATPIREDCGTGWGCRARALKPRRRTILRPLVAGEPELDFANGRLR